MNKFEKIFGSGPKGLLISLSLLAIFLFIEKFLSSLQITDNNILRYSIFGVLSLLTATIIIWSIKSLPPHDRGNKLITFGAFKYFRHPLYAAFLTFFNFGLAVLLNNWIYIIWALAQHPVWHWNIRGEEKLMEKEFPGEYEKYSQETGRFFPKFSKKIKNAT
ncbi:MAG: isoprenylcysteine carboxylmethyltransferase family protein [Ignavibacteriaceae bacterium]